MSNYEQYYVFDDPVPYKSLMLYPIKVKDYDLFSKCSLAFLLEKNSVRDLKILSMSYLGYLYYLRELGKENGQIDYVLLLDVILHLSLRDKEGKITIQFGYEKDQLGKDKPVLKIGDEKINETEFEEIKNIICEQNMIELPDETIQKEVREKMEEARRMKNKSNDKPASFEDLVLCIVASTSQTFEQVCDMTIRKFVKLLRRIDAKLHYQIYMTAAMSGMVEFKDKSVLRHWMSELEDKKNSDVMLDFEQVKRVVEGKI